MSDGDLHAVGWGEGPSSLVTPVTAMRVGVGLYITSKRYRLGGSPGLVVKGRDSRSKGRGFESRLRILDGHFFHIYL